MNIVAAILIFMGIALVIIGWQGTYAQVWQFLSAQPGGGETGGGNPPPPNTQQPPPAKQGYSLSLGGPGHVL